MKITRSLTPILFFSKKEKEYIEASIQEAENSTSAEIRVHLERVADQDILSHAKRVFEKLGMTKTASRNAVLIFLGVKSKRFAVIGDQGIHTKVSEHFWGRLCEEMAHSFSQDHFAEGISEAIQEIGRELAKYYPVQKDDLNELKDEISYSL